MIRISFGYREGENTLNLFTHPLWLEHFQRYSFLFFASIAAYFLFNAYTAHYANPTEYKGPTDYMKLVLPAGAMLLCLYIQVFIITQKDFDYKSPIVIFNLSTRSATLDYRIDHYVSQDKTEQFQIPFSDIKKIIFYKSVKKLTRTSQEKERRRNSLDFSNDKLTVWNIGLQMKDEFKSNENLDKIIRTVHLYEPNGSEPQVLSNVYSAVEVLLRAEAEEVLKTISQKTNVPYEIFELNP